MGLLCLILLSVLLYQRYHPNPLAFAKPLSNTLVLSESTTEHGLPVRLQIPNVAIDLAVFPSEIQGTTWETTPKGVSYLMTSPRPGGKGNAIFYGHNWPSLLGHLSKVDVGDSINVFFKDGSASHYTVEFITIVRPEQTKILDNSADSRLTIYTCTGFLDQKRFVVTALLQ